MASTHPNKAKMNAAVDRWIADAAVLPNGADLLERKTGVIERDIQTLALAAERDDRIPVHLRGLTAIDLTLASSKLTRAAQAMRDAKSAPADEVAA